MLSTLVAFQSTRFTKSFLAHITFVRFLVRVNTHVYGQEGWSVKHLLANAALVLRSLSLRSFPKISFFFLYLFVLLLLLLLIRYSQTQQHSLFFSLQSFFSLLSVARDHHRFRVHRALRMWILFSHFLFLCVVYSRVKLLQTPNKNIFSFPLLLLLKKSRMSTYTSLRLRKRLP